MTCLFLLAGIFILSSIAGLLGTNANKTSIRTSLKVKGNHLKLSLFTCFEIIIITLRNVAKALNFFSSLVTSRNSTTGCCFLMGITSPLSWVANLHSSREDSPLRIFFSLMGKRINLLLYSFKRWMLRWRDSTDLFLRLRSTAMPTVLAKPAGIPAP